MAIGRNEVLTMANLRPLLREKPDGRPLCLHSGRPTGIQSILVVLRLEKERDVTAAGEGLPRGYDSATV